jgi:hypothetical protein
MLARAIIVGGVSDEDGTCHDSSASAPQGEIGCPKSRWHICEWVYSQSPRTAFQQAPGGEKGTVSMEQPAPRQPCEINVEEDLYQFLAAKAARASRNVSASGQERAEVLRLILPDSRSMRHTTH